MGITRDRLKTCGIPKRVSLQRCIFIESLAFFRHLTLHDLNSRKLYALVYFFVLFKNMRVLLDSHIRFTV